MLYREWTGSTVIPTRRVPCPVCGSHVTQASTGTLQRHKAKPKWGFGGKILNKNPSDWCPGGGVQKVATTPESNVNHPGYYGGEENPYEAIKVIEAWELGFCLGNTVKYISRAGRKDPKKLIEDLQKASWYLNREIEHLRERSQDLHGS